MSLQAKLQPVMIRGTALLGLILGRYTILGGVSTVVVEIFLMLLLYTLFMNVDLKQLLGALKNTRYTMASLVINFLSILPINLLLQIILMPIYLLVFVGGDMQLQLVFLLFCPLLLFFVLLFIVGQIVGRLLRFILLKWNAKIN